MKIEKFKEAERLRDEIKKLNNKLESIKNFINKSKSEEVPIFIESSYSFQIEEPYYTNIRHAGDSRERYTIRMSKENILYLLIPFFKENKLKIENHIHHLEDKFKNISCE